MTKRIQMIQSYATDRQGFLAGREYELDNPEANELISAGIAKDVEATEAPPAKVNKGKIKHGIMDTIPADTK